MTTDADLVVSARGGDEGAFATLYDRYADRLHDFCYSMLRDPSEAADATQQTFVVAAEKLAMLREPEKIKAWLYAIARNDCLKRTRGRRREVGLDRIPEPAAHGHSSEQTLEGEELRNLVWSAADGLNERDRALLELNVRQGLDGQELADAMGMKASQVYVLMSRMRDQVERSLSALLVARTGRRDCPELDALLVDWKGRLNPLLRKRISRHVENCEVCLERRRAVVSPLALLGAIPIVPAPLFLRDRVLAGLHSDGSGTGPPRSPSSSRMKFGQRTGFPLSTSGAPTTMLIVCACVVVVAASGGTALGFDLTSGHTTTTPPPVLLHRPQTPTHQTTTTLGTTATQGTTTTQGTSTTTSSKTTGPMGKASSGTSRPGAPTALTGTTGDDQVTASWVAPADDGGTPIISYTVTSSPGVATCTTTATSCAVTGLLNGDAYTFTVTATNTHGTGPASLPSNPVTPS